MAPGTRSPLGDFLNAIPISNSFVQSRDQAVVLEMTKGRDAVRALQGGLSPVGGDVEEWDIDGWLDHALGAGDPIIAARRVSGGDLIGFTSFQQSFYVRAHGDRATLCLEFDFVSVYVAPEVRGMGVAAALRTTVERHVGAVIEGLAALPREFTDPAREVELEIAVSANLQSEGGARFFERIRSAIEGAVERIQASTLDRYSSCSVEWLVDDFAPPNAVVDASAVSRSR